MKSRQDRVVVFLLWFIPATALLAISVRACAGGA